MHLVSVIMNCYNSEIYLKESLKSILNQDYKNWELIFLDNHSTDNSKKIFNSFKDKRFKYFRLNKKHPLGIARHKASCKAKGKYLCFLDTDDIWLPKKFPHKLKYWQSLMLDFQSVIQYFLMKKNKNSSTKKIKIFLKMFFTS